MDDAIVAMDEKYGAVISTNEERFAHSKTIWTKVS